MKDSVRTASHMAGRSKRVLRFASTCSFHEDNSRHGRLWHYMRLCESVRRTRQPLLFGLALVVCTCRGLFRSLLTRRYGTFTTPTSYILKRNTTSAYLPPAGMVHMSCIVSAVPCHSLRIISPAHRTSLDTRGICLHGWNQVERMPACERWRHYQALEGTY
jgi:hypothetical protein